MIYDNITGAQFISRPNRFIANVLLCGVETVVHVKNTGRCRELLVPGRKVWLCRSDNPSRKTLYDLVAVEKGDLLINMDSSAPNKAFEEWAQGKFPGLKIEREVTYKDSRFDFLLTCGDKKTFVEVKGVTLENKGGVFFPDAPTLRGTKHLNSLMDAVGNGYKACVFFVVQMAEASYFSPNYHTDKVFGETLKKAAKKGVQIEARKCRITPESMCITDSVKVIL